MTKRAEALMRNPWSLIVTRATESKNLQNRLRFRHAAFGGTLYQQGRGSHGCVNLPVGSAADLFGIIQSGDVVVCHW